MPTVPLTRPWTGQEELEAVARVLRSGMLVQGPRVEELEQRVAARCGRRFGIAVSSGTSALSLALEALGVGRGDEVIVPALTWPSPAHAVLSRGAIPVLADVDPHEWNGTGATLAAGRSDHTRAAIVIDQFGNPARRGEITRALDGVTLVEDAACALGSLFEDGSPCGSMGLVSCFSFHPRKILTTGEGGMCLTDEAELAHRLRALRNHGQGAPGRFETVGENHRLSDVAAAIGVAQMDRLDAILDARRRRARAYADALPGFLFQRAPEGAQGNAQTCGVLAPAGLTRARVIEALRAQDIEAGALSYALHRVPSVGASARCAEPLTNTEAIAERGLAIPLHPRMSDADQERVIDALSRLVP